MRPLQAQTAQRDAWLYGQVCSALSPRLQLGPSSLAQTRFGFTFVGSIREASVARKEVFSTQSCLSVSLRARLCCTCGRIFELELRYSFEPQSCSSQLCWYLTSNCASVGATAFVHSADGLIKRAVSETECLCSPLNFVEVSTETSCWQMALAQQ